jgi:endonuclease/exonuclease/phosphatase family metal-dependent hydrolase
MRLAPLRWTAPLITATALLVPLTAHPSVSAVAATTTHLRVMSYNVLKSERDGTRADSGATIAPWSQRRPGIVGYIHDAAPDVLAMQEASGWVNRVKGPRQADDVVSHLGGDWRLAHTEVAPGEAPGWKRTGRYIAYRSNVLGAVGGGGHWRIGGSDANPTWAAYQMFEVRATAQRFLLVSAHLINGNGTSYDQARESETRQLIADARAVANGQPVVYAGDFNSHTGKRVTFDGPRVAMHDKHMRDAIDIASKRLKAKYNSANQYERRPPAFRDNVDHIWVPRGVTVGVWREMLHLHDGQFVGTIPSDHNAIVANLTFG